MFKKLKEFFIGPKPERVRVNDPWKRVYICPRCSNIQDEKNSDLCEKCGCDWRANQPTEKIGRWTSDMIAGPFGVPSFVQLGWEYKEDSE